MNSDSIFGIGSTHHICQDYACHSNGKEGHFAIIADGCSGSPNTDFGSRILCSLVKESMFRFHYHQSIKNFLNLYQSFCSYVDIIHQGNCILNNLSLSNKGLDSTLLYIYTNAKFLEINISGDGYIVFKKKNGDMVVYNKEYSKGYPFYLSYLGGRGERFKAHQKIEGNTIEHSIKIINPEGKVIEEWDCDRIIKDNFFNKLIIKDNFFNKLFVGNIYYKIEEIKKRFDYIAVISDGAGTFYRHLITDTSKTNEPITAVEILPELLSFKNYTGQFVKRRFKKFSKKMESQNIFHYDDISLGVVYLGN